MSDEWVAVGSPNAPCPGESSPCGGVDLYRRNGIHWPAFTTLSPDAPVAGSYFGSSISMRGNLLIVGAPLQGMGAAYVFRWNGSAWIQEAQFEGVQVDPTVETFGVATAIQGAFAVVGAVRGACTPEFCGGAAYVYFFDSCLGEWVYVGTLQGSRQVENDGFGQSVAMDQGVIVVGAPGAAVEHPKSDCCTARDTPGCSISWCETNICLKQPHCCTEAWSESCASAALSFGNEFCNCGVGAEGIAYVFEHSNFVTWTESSILSVPSPTTGDGFGTSVEVVGHTIAVGAPYAESSSIVHDAGAVYLFQSLRGDWTQTARLAASNPLGGSMFGTDVAMSATGVLVGAPDAHCKEPPDCDIAYFYRFNGQQWDENLLPLAASFGTRFGESAGLGDSFAAVAAIDFEFPSSMPGRGAGFVFAVGGDDCNCNEKTDHCERWAGSAFDCNLNGQLDSCDIAEEISADCNGDGIPNECDTDCQDNGVPDGCDIASGESADCNRNAYPDECELTGPDCNRNGVTDELELQSPSTVFQDGFEEGRINPVRWLTATKAEVRHFSSAPDNQYKLEIERGGVLESKSIDLFGAYLAMIQFDIGPVPNQFTWLDVEAWDGAEWRLLRREILYERSTPPPTMRTLDLPSWALHREFRFRLHQSYPYAPFGFIDNVRVTRQDGDCNGSGVLDSCEVSACGVEDCNSNGFPDVCDFHLFRPGHREDYSVGDSPNDVASGDFDQDGDVDLAVARGRFTGGGTVVTLLNQGDGFFDPAEGSSLHPEVGGWARAIAAGDLDADGDMDLAVATRRVAVVKNRGGVWGGWAAPIYLGPIEQAQDVALGDVNDDGAVDIVAVFSPGFGGGGQRTVALNDGFGDFFTGDAVEFGVTPRSVCLFDADGDGDLDLAAADQFLNAVLVALNGGGRRGAWAGFGPPTELPSSAMGATQTFFVAAPDLNGDTFADLVVVNPNLNDMAATVAVLVNLGIENETWLGFASPMEHIVGLSAFSAAPADADGDGWIDLLVAVRDSHYVAMLQNRGVDTSGAWLGLHAPDRPTPVGWLPVAVAAVDVDHDGVPDIVTANRAKDSVGVPVGTPSASVIRQVPPADHDCNGNQAPDRCDVLVHGGVDCNFDFVPDECQADCNGNEVPDDCDVQDQTAFDCQANGILDSCELDRATALDCDGNRIPDECEAVHTFSAASGYLYPLYEDVPLEYLSLVIEDPPPALYDVTLDVRVVVRRGSSTMVRVHLDDEVVAEVPGDSLTFCPLNPDRFSLTIPADDWNQAAADGRVAIGFSTTTSSGCPSANPTKPYVLASVSYLVEGPSDENRNFFPDACDVDFDRDGDVDLFDAAQLANCYGRGLDPVNPVCRETDFNGDFRVGESDFSAFQRNLTGPQ